MNLTKSRIFVAKNELIDAIEVRDRGRMRWYSYTYKIRGRKGNWRPLVRWDNIEAEPHVDKYDEGGALLEQKPCQEQTLSGARRLVTNFRRNLLAMEIAYL